MGKAANLYTDVTILAAYLITKQFFFAGGERGKCDISDQRKHEKNCGNTEAIILLKFQLDVCCSANITVPFGKLR